MSRAQVPTLDFFTVLHTTFLFMVLCLQVAARGSKEELGKDCGVTWATDYTLEDGEYKCEGSTYDKQETWNKVPQNPVRYGCWFWSWSASPIFFHCCHLSYSFGLFLLPTVLLVLWNLFHCTHTLYLHTPPYAIPSFPCSCLQLSSLVSSHLSIPALPFCFPHHSWRLFDIALGK